MERARRRPVALLENGDDGRSNEKMVDEVSFRFFSLFFKRGTTAHTNQPSSRTLTALPAIVLLYGCTPLGVLKASLMNNIVSTVRRGLSTYTRSSSSGGSASSCNMRRRRFMGGRDRTLFGTTWAPRDPRGAEVAGAWADVQCHRDVSIGAHHVRFVQNRTMNVRR